MTIKQVAHARALRCHHSCARACSYLGGGGSDDEEEEPSETTTYVPLSAALLWVCTSLLNVFAFAVQSQEKSAFDTQSDTRRILPEKTDQTLRAARQLGTKWCRVSLIARRMQGQHEE